MMQERWTEVDRYLAESLVRADPSLDAAIKASRASGLPSWDVSPHSRQAAIPDRQAGRSPLDSRNRHPGRVQHHLASEGVAPWRATDFHSR